MMRASPVRRDDRSLEERLRELDAQLRTFEASLRAQQQSHGRVRGLELELAEVVQRAAAVARDLTDIRDDVRRVAETAAREAATPAADHLKAFEERGQHLLDAYAEAVRAAQQAVARAEARIDAFDERVGRELAQAGKEIREAAELLRDVPRSDRLSSPVAGVRRLVPALLAVAVLILAIAGYSWLTRTVREASARAETAERQAADLRRDANQQIASVERKAEQVSEAVRRAVQAERIASIAVAPDARRMAMRGYGKAVSASGQALWSPSQGLVISGSQLPVPSQGETYQVWLVTASDSVSLGLLTPDAFGRITGVFDLPSGLRSPRGFMITRERAGGAARPSAAVVLAT
jgi:anti-sigma-K factor RskA